MPASQDLLARLVAFDTTSRRSNLDLIDWVADYLFDHGLRPRLSYSDDQHKANLFVRIGADDAPALVLSGHTDVVPVDGQDWHTNPFTLTEKDGRLYGRGSADMKGFIASSLALVPQAVDLARAGRLARPIALALSYDEEVGCLGVRRLIADVVAAGERVSGVIVGEPTEMRPVIAHKGIAQYRVKVTGREAHSSLTPYGVNAIEYAAKLIVHLRRLAETEAAFGHRNALYDVPFTTLQTGLVTGGVAANIVPRDCEFVFECRWLPGDDPQRFTDSLLDYVGQLVGEMREVAPEADIRIEPLVHCPAFESEEGSAVRTETARLCGCADGAGVAYATEAGLFQEAGFPAVVCGPGSIREAHKPNEFVEAAQLAACDDWLARLLVPPAR
ncbi:acetylornithine deacetylase [Crenobacter luteus]|uniref:Acetylornithine deacetylase n=1 Tax=Crenobacter luteus TaxID=1452487 RepID=A0A165G247_9NEIS|nr:acetylornithine deacetylase [Crenobacter luteus]KZE34902.1 acetylornithine deacetylase [Crenobacter luteus]